MLSQTSKIIIAIAITAIVAGGAIFLWQGRIQQSRQPENFQIEQIEQTGQPQQPIVLKERKRKILSLLDKNEWRNIRDICHSLPGLATKSVQRDLLEMVGAGILKKEGNKRWRKYSVVG